MARTNNLTNFLTDVASAIKTKTGDSSLIPASQFDIKIAGITTGKLSNEEYTKANNNLDEILYQSENILPDAYQEVEYLISDGYEYIDTGYAFTNPELKLEVKYRKTSTLARNVFGVDLSKNPRKMHGNVFRNALYIGNSAVINDVPQELGVDYTLKFEFKNNVAKWNVNGIEYTYNGANSWEGVSDDETEYLFANRGAQSAQYLLIGRIYYARFYDNNGDLVRNFVPCYRKSDNEAGMYDTVNNVFYTNEGTREFAVGADVDVLNTKIESVLTEKNTKILPSNIKKDVNILGVTGTYEGGSTSTNNAKILPRNSNTYFQVFQYIEYIDDNYDVAGIADLRSLFTSFASLKRLPTMNTSSVTNLQNWCNGCSSLIDVPVYDFSNVTNNYNVFANCPSLSNDSLNNILQMCIGMTGVTNKTLKYMGLSSTQATTCQSLSNWSNFVAAGWSTGY